MRPSGVRAKNFIRGGTASSVFASKRRVLAPASSKPSLVEANPQSKSRFGKASGLDYLNFFSGKKNTKAIRSAIVSLKNLLVEGFMAAKSLRASIGNIVGQIKGLGKGTSGGGIGKLGIIGIVAAVVVGVAAIFGPQIKKAYEFIVGQAENVFENVKGFLSNIDEKIKGIYTFVMDLYNNKFVGLIETYNNAVQTIADKIGIPLPKIGQPEKMPSYEQAFGAGGFNFLEGKTLGGMVGSIGSGIGDFLGGTGDFMGDIFNNFLSMLGLTEKGNQASSLLGLGNMFGPQRAVTNPFNLKRSSSSSTRASGAADFTGGSNAEKIFNFYKSQGFTPEQAAGFVGNYYQESKYDPKAVNQIGATGIGQWLGSRKDDLYNYAASNNLNPLDIETQLKFTMTELQGSESRAMSQIKKAKTVEEASMAVRIYYERPGEHEAHDENRIRAAKQAIQKFNRPQPTTQQQYTVPLSEMPDADATPAEWEAHFERLKKLTPPKKGPNVSVITVPGVQQVASRRPQRIIQPDAGRSLGGSSTVAFYSTSNSDNVQSSISGRIANGVIG